jgi:hypothetical protein
MTRAQAERRAALLDALAAPGSNAYPAERAAAKAKAAALRSKYGLDRPAPRPRAQAQPRGRRARPTWTAPASGAAWEFNVQTQERSSNVKVKRYTDRANWSIEITDW